jgi:phospholysine phosphohistidine inorganic pyrophosphate phosphatase
MKAILFDLDGVVYQGDTPVSGAAEALGWVREAGIPHRFVTNTTSRPRAAVADKLAAMDIKVDAATILTPVVVAGQWLRRHGATRVAAFIPEATRSDLGLPALLPEDRERGADAVVIGDLGEDWDFHTLNRAFRLLTDTPQPHLLALGMTRYWRAADGLRLDTAPFVAALEHARDVTAVVVGKPAQAFFTAALAELDVPARETIMIGDDIRADIQGAQRAGLRGVCVRTGKFRPTDLEGDIRPDAVIDSIAALPEWWRAHATTAEPGAR